MKIIHTTNSVSFAVDDDKFEWLSRYKWRAIRRKRSWYAVCDVGPSDKRTRINMHRIIARTPLGFVCHHIDGNSRNNQIKNLINQSPREHNRFHSDNKILIKYSCPDTSQAKILHYPNRPISQTIPIRSTLPQDGQYPFCPSFASPPFSPFYDKSRINRLSFSIIS